MGQGPMSGPDEWVIGCPICDAGVGEPCVDTGVRFGTPVGSSGWHISRWVRVPEAEVDRVKALGRQRLQRESGLSDPEDNGER